MPVPSYHPCAYHEYNVITVKEVSHRRNHSDWGETPLSVKFVIEYFSRTEKGLVLFLSRQNTEQTNNTKCSDCKDTGRR
jgi:hypothetical protein